MALSVTISTRNEPSIALNLIIAFKKVNGFDHIVHLSFEGDVIVSPITELRKPERFSVLFELVHELLHTLGRTHIAVQCETAHIVEIYPRLCEKLVQPLPRVVVIRERSIIHRRSYNLHSQLLSDCYQPWPILRRLRGGHIGLVSKIRLVVGQQILALRVRTFERTERVLGPIGIPSHRAKVHPVLLELREGSIGRAGAPII